jgi:hypothetical protein
LIQKEEIMEFLVIIAALVVLFVAPCSDLERFERDAMGRVIDKRSKQE